MEEQPKYLQELDYPMQLLEAANEMLVQQRYEVSIVTAQMACEICTERVLRKYFSNKEIKFIEDAIDELLPSYNLLNSKVRNLYVALTGDKITQQFFWAEYKVLVNLRNKAIHAGSRMQLSQAQMCIRIARLVVKHLQIVEQKKFNQ